MQIIEVTEYKKDRIKETFDQAKRETDPLRAGFRAGLATALDLLGIRIEEVNYFASKEIESELKMLYFDPPYPYYNDSNWKEAYRAGMKDTLDILNIEYEWLKGD